MVVHLRNCFQRLCPVSLDLFAAVRVGPPHPIGIGEYLGAPIRTATNIYGAIREQIL
jgi:hypothetical protein